MKNNNIKIRLSTTEELKKIQPNICFNRFDLQNVKKYFIAEVGDNNEIIPFYIDKECVITALYLRLISTEAWKQFTDYVFTTYHSILMIYVHHTLTPQNFPSTLHCTINLPSSLEKYNQTLSSRVRYNTKWYPKKLTETYGDYHFIKYKRNDIPDEVMNLFALWKKKAFNYIVPNNFYDIHVVTDVYVMYVNKTVAAIGICSCIDNSEDVFYASTAYNNLYAKYSVGSILFYHIISDLIQQGKKRFLLHGGENHTYKHMFGGVNQQTWNGYIFSTKVEKYGQWLLKLQLPSVIKKLILHTFYKFIFSTYNYRSIKKYLKINQR